MKKIAGVLAVIFVVMSIGSVVSADGGERPIAPRDGSIFKPLDGGERP
ncbi:MAG TPA: hypothetical protein VE710_18150 [Candidatus Bathyarchaeia archaeon]|nr:hypothetical protein [Candidatus Bathyarchaeia archaeon]